MTSKQPHSAKILENQIPSTPMISGMVKTADAWNTRERITAEMAEIFPLFRAVNKADV